MSVYKITRCSLNQLRCNVLHYDDFEVNLLSCMTLELEHLHSVVNHKQGFQKMLPHVRSFTASVRESIKSLTQWSTYFFTSKYSWYSLPENSLPLKYLKLPTPFPPAPMSNEDKVMMREWVSVNSGDVRQRRVRQETTIVQVDLPAKWSSVGSSY